MRKNFLIIGTITAACAAVSGCAEKKEGPQTIIIELADPADIEESSMADESASTEVPESESESFAEEITTDSDERYPQIEGLSDNVTLSYTQIGSDDPIIGLVIADILPDIHAKDLNITNVQAYIDDEEVVPYGDVTFSMDVDPDSQVVLYKLDENGKITSEQLEVTDGTVSYQTSKCGRWLIISSNLESETETETMESECLDGERMDTFVFCSAISFAILIPCPFSSAVLSPIIDTDSVTFATSLTPVSITATAPSALTGLSATAACNSAIGFSSAAIGSAAFALPSPSATEMTVSTSTNSDLL